MQNRDLLDLAQLRNDGRRSHELRPFKHRIGLVPSSDGSAYMEQGLNKILVLINGPKEPKKKSNDGFNDKCVITTNVLLAPFSGTERKRRRQGDRRVIENEKIITDVAESIIMTELYPRSEISITVHVLQTDGSMLCLALNTVFLALLNAGISMSDMLAACSVGYVNNHLCVDLNYLEIALGGAFMPVVVKARTEEIVFFQLDSRLSIEYLQEAMDKSIEACRKVRLYLENAIKKDMIEHLEKAK